MLNRGVFVSKVSFNGQYHVHASIKVGSVTALTTGFSMWINLFSKFYSVDDLLSLKPVIMPCPKIMYLRCLGVHQDLLEPREPSLQLMSAAVMRFPTPTHQVS